MSRHASELCATLVDDIYGELTSLLFKILLRYGRLSVPALEHHTCLSRRLIKHGLSVLVQHQLVLWYTSDSNGTVYEANVEVAYNLVRSGKYVKVVEDQLSDFAGQVISSLLSLGHAQVGDLVRGFNASMKIHINGSMATSGASDKTHLSEGKSMEHGAEGPLVTSGMLQATLCDLLQAGFISQVHESHFRSAADNRIEAETVVPPPEYYKAKSKKENDAQWEASIQKRLAQWKHGKVAETVEVKTLNKGKKRLLREDPEDSPKQKRYSPGLHKVNGVTGGTHGSNTYESDILDDEVTLRINHAKFVVALRNNYLIELVDQTICTRASKVYATVLRTIEPGVLECKDEADLSDDPDTEADLSSLPQITTNELASALQDSADLANALGKVDDSMLDLARNEHRKKRRKREPGSDDDEKMADGGANLDENDEDSSDDDASTLSSASENVKGEVEHDPDALVGASKNYHREAIRDHLLLLANHPLGFLHHYPQSEVLPERWGVNFPALMQNATQHSLMANIANRHGKLHARLVRILNEYGKVGEKELCTISLIKQQTLRGYLATLMGDGAVYVQEVPRDAGRTVQRTLFLWFYDGQRYKAKLLEDTYKAMTRCLQRAHVEGDKVKATVEKANRTDVIGKEEQFLTVQEREALEKWRAVEEKLWGEIGRLDDLVAVLRDY